MFEQIKLAWVYVQWSASPWPKAQIIMIAKQRLSVFFCPFSTVSGEPHWPIWLYFAFGGKQFRGCWLSKATALTRPSLKHKYLLMFMFGERLLDVPVVKNPEIKQGLSTHPAREFVYSLALFSKSVNAINVTDRDSRDLTQSLKSSYRTWPGL